LGKIITDISLKLLNYGKIKKRKGRCKLKSIYNNMQKIFRDFVSDEKREFKYKLGRLIASGLSGFIAGVIAASIFWNVIL